MSFRGLLYHLCSSTATQRSSHFWNQNTCCEHTISSGCHDTPKRQGTLVPPLHRWGEWGQEQAGNLLGHLSHLWVDPQFLDLINELQGSPVSNHSTVVAEKTGKPVYTRWRPQQLGFIAFWWVPRDSVVAKWGEREKYSGLITNWLRVIPRNQARGPPSLDLSSPVGGKSQTTEPFTSKVLKNLVNNLYSL